MTVLISAVLILLIVTSVLLSKRKTESAYGVGWLVGVSTGFAMCWFIYVAMSGMNS